MKKYTFLVFHKEYDAFLEQLREAGVVHISQKAE
jgi:V/A-type H+-transporting ATPase subunit I